MIHQTLRAVKLFLTGQSPCATITADPGTAPIRKNSGQKNPAISKRGVTPIAKNINVVDEQGNRYEATYPKRAKGLVKSGRARFISEDTICLARLPITKLEAQNMTNQTASAEYTIPYILQQIAAIQSETTYLNEVIGKLAGMTENKVENPGGGNVPTSAMAQALSTVVACRETTNQQLLHLYEKMYDDLTHKKA